MTTRRQILKAGIGGAGLLAAGSIARSAAWAQDLRTIRVTQFGGPYQQLEQIIGEPFAKAGKGKVVYEAENSVSATTKLQAQQGNPPFNVVMLSRGVTVRAGATGLLKAVDPGAIEGTEELVDGAVAPEGYGVAMLIDAIDIMYDSDKVDAPIESWLDLWRPDLAGKIVMPSASLPVYFTIMAVARALGEDPNSDAGADAAFSKLAELKGNVRTFYGDPVQASQMVERGEVVAAVQFGGRISAVTKNNPAIVRATPKEGVPAIPYDLAITAGSGDQDVSADYIEMAISKEIQTALAENLLVTPAHKDVSVPSDLDKYMVPLDKFWFPDETYAARMSRDWSRRWQREIQS